MKGNTSSEAIDDRVQDVNLRKIEVVTPVEKDVQETGKSFVSTTPPPPPRVRGQWNSNIEDMMASEPLVVSPERIHDYKHGHTNK